MSCSKINTGTFYTATLEELSDLQGFIEKLKRLGSFKCGAVRVKTPYNYRPTVETLEVFRTRKINNPFKQDIKKLAEGFYGIKRGNFEEQIESGTKGGKSRKMSVKNLEKQRINKIYRAIETVEDLERFDPVPDGLLDASVQQKEEKIWSLIRGKGDSKEYKNISFYASDVEGSLMDRNSETLSFANLYSILRNVVHKYNIAAYGITTPMLYIGIFGSLFVNHLEDKNAWSMSFLHYGKGKIWYTTPPEYAKQFEAAVDSAIRQIYKSEFHHDCCSLFRHKNLLVDLDFLVDKNIPVYKHVQEPGDLIIVPPQTYHFGFNVGFNAAEAINWGDVSWIPSGLLANECEEVKREQPLDMFFFVYELMYERLVDYLNGELWLENEWDGSKEKRHIPPPEIKTDERCNHVEVLMSGVEALLAFVVFKGEEFVYASIGTEKMWISRVLLETLNWTYINDKDYKVSVPDDYFNMNRSCPPKVLALTEKPVPVLISDSIAPCLSSSHQAQRVSEPPPANENVPVLINPKKRKSSLEECPTCSMALENFHPKTRRRHVNSCGSEPFKCLLCPVTFTRNDNLKRHLKLKHSPE